MSEHELQSFSRQKLYSLVNRQKREINCLKTDLLRFKLLSIRYQKCLDFLENINEKYNEFKDYLEIRKEINDLNVINDKLCIVSVNELQTNCEINDCNQNTINAKEVFTQTENSNQFIVESNEDLNDLKSTKSCIELNAKEVTDYESEGFECDLDLDYMNDSNDETIDGSVEQICGQNEDIVEVIDKSFEELSKNSLKEEKCESIEENIRKSDVKSNKTDFESNEREIKPKKLYFCDYPNCGHKALYYSRLLLHKQNHSTDPEFNCPNCGIKFNNKYLLRKHRLRLHPNEFEDIEWIECLENGCNFRTKAINSFNSHSKGVHKIMTKYKKKTKPKEKTIDGKYVCDWIGCEKQYERKRYLKSHKLSHLGNTFRCDWTDCTYSTNTRINLKKHQRRKHSNKYRCDWAGCEYKIGLKSQLESHKLKHSNERHFKCGLNNCQKLFKNEKQLRIHQLVVHPEQFDDIDWIECSENGCNFRTKLKTDLTNHTKTHSKPNVCNVCQKGFSQRHSLTSHMAIHTGSTEHKLRCEWPGCDRYFVSNYTLKDHLNSHSKDIVYPCLWPNCDKTYSIKKSLNIHMRRHKQLSYRCDWNGCEYQSTNPIRFRNHKNRHQNGLIV